MIGIPILVADDDEIARCLLVENLTSWGYAPITYPNGQAALEALRQPDAPQIAILDWNMPELSGVEICRQLRERQPDQYTFVVLLTHRDQYADRIAGLESGADDFVTKPFDPRELQLRLRTAIRILELQAQLEEARDVYRHEAGTFTVWRVSANHWECARIDGQWKVTRRTNRLLDGNEAARDILRTASQ